MDLRRRLTPAMPAYAEAETDEECRGQIMMLAEKPIKAGFQMKEKAL